jgi:hypothetical protein
MRQGEARWVIAVDDGDDNVRRQWISSQFQWISSQLKAVFRNDALPVATPDLVIGLGIEVWMCGLLVSGR